MQTTFSTFRACLILFYHCVFSTTSSYAQIAGDWKVTPNLTETETPWILIKNNIENIQLTIYDVNLNASNKDFYFEFRSENANCPLKSTRVYRKDFKPAANNLAYWQGNFTLLAVNTTATRAHLVLSTEMNDLDESNQNNTIKKALHERIFQLTSSAIILFMFINLGTVLDLNRLKSIALFPIGPAVAFTSRYIIMPALGLAFGILLFPEDKNLQLAVFFSMMSPSGGIANICNFLMRGNIDLSIAATTLNSLMTLAMFPIWIILLGRVVYKRTGLTVPFVNLVISFLGILAALMFGIGMRVCFPKQTVKIVRFLKPLSVVLSLLLVVVTVAVHITTFRYFSLLIAVSALVLPLISYFLTYGLAKLCCMENNDAMTISLEIGVMNMTVPTLLLNTSLPSVEANQVLALPITCALVSLMYVVLFYCKRRYCHWHGNINTKSKMYIAE